MGLCLGLLAALPFRLDLADGFQLVQERSRTLSKSESPEPLVTIGLPVHNGERYLTEAIESLLNQTSGLLGRHVSSDKGFIAELSLHGKFFQIPEYQFFRRMHEGSSSWATADEAHQARLYHAAHVRRIPFNYLRWHWRLAEAVHRSPLGIRDRARAYKFLAKLGWWHRMDLMRELSREARLAAKNRR